jgi:hypothetical protein
MTAIRILVVTNLYPTAERPFMSTFVKEQVESMRKYYADLGFPWRVKNLTEFHSSMVKRPLLATHMLIYY